MFAKVPLFITTELKSVESKTTLDPIDIHYTNKNTSKTSYLVFHSHTLMSRFGTT